MEDNLNMNIENEAIKNEDKENLEENHYSFLRDRLNYTKQELKCDIGEIIADGAKGYLAYSMANLGVDDPYRLGLGAGLFGAFALLEGSRYNYYKEKSESKGMKFEPKWTHFPVRKPWTTLSSYTDKIFRKVVGVETYYSNKFFEKPIDKALEYVPGYAEKRDKALERCSHKLLEGEKLNLKDEFKVGFQAPSVKTSLAVCGAVAGLASSTGNPLIAASLAPPFVFFGALHQSAMGEKLERIFDDFSEEEKTELKKYLNQGKIDDVRNMYYEKRW